MSRLTRICIYIILIAILLIIACNVASFIISANLINGSLDADTFGTLNTVTNLTKWASMIIALASVIMVIITNRQ